jgi:integrase/recombinase XerD
VAAFKISTVLILIFLVLNSVADKKGHFLIRCRFTYFKKKKELSTGLFMNPVHWKSKKQTAFIADDENYLNNQLILMKQ